MQAITKEPNRTYLVYPSWAELTCRWENVPKVLVDPVASGLIDASVDYQSLGYPEALAPARVINGPAGGGIIGVDLVPPAKWLPALALSSDALIRSTCMLPEYFRVSYLEPMDDLEATIDSSLANGMFLCPIHAIPSSTVLKLTLAIGHRAALPDALVRATVLLFGSFRLQLNRTFSVRPKELLGAYDYTYFDVIGDAGLGFAFAVVVYCFLSLKKEFPTRFELATVLILK